MPVHSSSRNLSWPVLAALSGATAAAIACAILAASYYLQFQRMGPGWSWSLWTTSIAVLGPLAGAGWGLAVCGALRLGRRHGRPLLGAALGGGLGGIVPALISAVGYGSLHAPYAGTAPILASILVGIFVFGTLASMPTTTGLDRDQSRARALLCSATATIMIAAPFGLTGLSFGAAALPEAVIRDFVALVGNSRDDTSWWVLGTVGIVASLGLGSLLGLFVGITERLAATLRSAIR